MRRVWIVAGLAAALCAGDAAARMSTEEAAALLEHRFPVRVLRDLMEPITVDGKPAYRIRAIVEQPDTNGTMRVVTFMIDAWTGEMISAFRHLRSGYRMPADGSREANRQPTDAPRRGVWR